MNYHVSPAREESWPIMFQHLTHLRQQRSISRRSRPRGIAVVFVLGLLAITLAISYATLHGQGTTAQLAQNNSRALDARVAAQSGLAAALRKISENTWAGVDVPLSANITNHSWYQVTFATGDAKLAASDPSYNEYPFRLTIDATGTASDPLNPAVRSEHKSRCVVQLVRTALQPEPANWTTLTNHTVYQWAIRNVYTQFPVRINGLTLLHGQLFLATEYPGSSEPRKQYLEDLKKMQDKPLLDGGRPDYRPFKSPLEITISRQDSATKSLLESELKLTLNDSTAATTAPLTHPGSVLTYRLYPGGKEYAPPVLQTTIGNPIQDVTLGPDPVNNPLGIFRSTGPLSVQNNVRITGTIISDGTGPEIQVYGTNVLFQAPTLPMLYGSSQVQQLPAVLAPDDLRINSAADVTIRGYTMVWDEFELKRGSPTTRFDLRGNLVTCALLLKGHDTWTMTPSAWVNDWNTFKAGFSEILLANIRATLGLGSNQEVFFPDYMEYQRGFKVQPILAFSPDSSGVTPHWHDWSQPVYQPDPADPGLRWEVVRWEDNL